MKAAVDLLADPGAVLSSDFNPLECHCLGIAIGDVADAALEGLEFSEVTDGGFHFIDGGIRFGVVENRVEVIGLPQTFLARIGINNRAEVWAHFGPPDETFGVGVIGIKYVWNSGISLLLNELTGECYHILFYDPARPWLQ